LRKKREAIGDESMSPNCVCACPSRPRSSSYHVPFSLCVRAVRVGGLVSALRSLAHGGCPPLHRRSVSPTKSPSTLDPSSVAYRMTQRVGLQYLCRQHHCIWQTPQRGIGGPTRVSCTQKKKVYNLQSCPLLPHPPPKTVKLSPLGHLNVHRIQQC
jgi:hypothetical protein